MNKTIIVLALTIVVATLWRLDYVTRSLKEERREHGVTKIALDTAKNTANAQANLDDSIAKSQEEFQEVKTEKIYVDREVIKNVVVYKDRVVDRFVIPPDWVYTYNLSIRTVRELEGASGADGSSAGVRPIVDDAYALEVIAANNRACVDTMLRFGQLQTVIKVYERQGEKK